MCNRKRWRYVKRIVQFLVIYQSAKNNAAKGFTGGAHLVQISDTLLVSIDTSVLPNICHTANNSIILVYKTRSSSGLET